MSPFGVFLGVVMRTLSLVAMSLGMLALVAGCATNAEEIGTTDQALGVEVPNPSGAYVARVSANGTGCPAGTWDGAISPDGKTFTVTFSSYEATSAAAWRSGV